MVLASQKISQFPVATLPYAGTETFLGLQGGADKQFSINPTFTSVTAFGCKGDCTGAGVGTDNLSLLNTAVTTLLANNKGGTLFFPPGYYRITGPLYIGSPNIVPAASPNGYSLITARTVAETDANYTAASNSTNITANNLIRGVAINLHFAGGAFIVADFLPTSVTPVIGYFYNDIADSAYFQGVSIITPAMMTTGTYDASGASNGGTNGVPTSNNLIGIYVERGVKSLINTLVSGTQFGILAVNSFWVNILSYTANRCPGDGLNIAEGNGITVSSCNFQYCGRGVVFDGAASIVSGIHGEEVLEELTVFGADCCTFGPGYMEDVNVGGASGVGKYSIRLGTTSGGGDVIACKFLNLRVGNVRTSKKALRIWACVGCTFDGCRVYANGIDIDAVSNGTVIGGDFTAGTQLGLFEILYNGGIFGNNISMFNHPSSQFTVCGPWMFQINLTPGTIATSSTYTLTFTFPVNIGQSNVTGCISFLSGVPGRTIPWVGSATATSITINLTNTSTTVTQAPGNSTVLLTVFSGQ